MNKSKAYIVLMALELASIGIMYQVSVTNPFQQSTPTKLFFVTAMCCHVLASNADMSLPATVITFHVSGIVACQTLLWILIAQIRWFCLINFILLLELRLCYYNYIANIIQLLLPGTPSNSVQLPTMEGQNLPALP